MVLASFVIASGSMLVLLAVLQRLNRATYERGREAMMLELSGFLDDVTSPVRDVIQGAWKEMPVTIELSLHAIDYRVILPFAVVPYEDLLRRYGSAQLRSRMKELELEVVRDVLVGRVPRENGLAESLVTLEQRIPVAAEVLALRQHVPAELVLAIESARSTHEVDGLLRDLATHFPRSAEIPEAIEAASTRDADSRERVRIRFRQWMGLPRL